MSFEIIKEFENNIAQFFGAPYAVAVDCCTHGVELCLRYDAVTSIHIPKRTYISIPFLAKKLNLELHWKDEDWTDYYYLGENTRVIDAAVLWKKNSYIQHTFMCLSFQFQKHLSLGRGGMILCDSKNEYLDLKKMTYDGRHPDIPWRDQNIETMGYHYYMTPETAKLGLDKLQDAIDNPPKKWSVTDWPDLTKMEIFKR
jgi:dTDP-4-amino-4,6-dideoxygalactose transaminase